MDMTSQRVIQSAMALPESERAELAASLIRSLDSPTEDDVDAAWAAEIRRRIASIDNGEVRLIPWDEVMSDLGDRKNA